MTDQPTKGPFCLHTVGDIVCVTKAENSHLDLREIVNLRWILAAFHGPDREANARLFVHAVELVEAARAVVDSGRELRFQEAWNDIDEDEGADFEADLSDLRAIIAKIDGAK